LSQDATATIANESEAIPCRRNLEDARDIEPYRHTFQNPDLHESIDVEPSFDPKFEIAVKEK
jgi:hypothetical protein